jgi:DNA-binding transcriptional ArsR family regulator
MSSDSDSRGFGGARLMSQHSLFSLRGEGMRVELDKKSLFALASDTRVEILRALQPMRRTVTQLSETLDIDKAAVHRHLKKMEEGGLVKRYEDHGFVYYGLSWKARDLLSPNENTRIIIMLSVTWLFCIAIVFLVILGLTNIGHNLLSQEGAPNRSTYGDGQAVPDRARFNVDDTSTIVFLLPAASIAVIAAFLGYRGYRGFRRPFQKGPRSGSSTDRAQPE